MLHYGLDEAEAADQAFGVALYCSGEPVDPQRLDLTKVICNPDLNIEGFSAGALYYYAGKAKILTGDYATALTYLEKAAIASPLDPAPHISIATLYQSWLDRETGPEISAALHEAIRRTNALRNALVNRNVAPAELAPVDYELGLIAELQRDWATATRHYTLAIEEFGAHSQAAYLTTIALGRVQRQAGTIDEADATLQQAHELDPTAPWAALELAQLYPAARATAEAFLATARSVAPNQAYVDIIEAELCAAWQEFGCATSAYQRAEEKRPNSGWLAGRIGDFYRPAGESLPHQSWANAAGYYARAVQQRPDDPWAHDRLAFALFYQRNYAEAANHFAVSLHQLSHPQSQVAERYCNLAQVQQAALLFDDALENAQTCLNKLQNPDLQASVEALIAQIQEAQNTAK
jgi:tetratricopeptide (TPR) repeat protein